MTLRRRVAVVALCAVALVVSLGVLVAGRFADAVSAGIEVFTELDPAADRAEALLLSRVQAEGDLQDLVISGDERFRDAFRHSVQRADTALAQLTGQLGDDPGFAPLLERAAAAGATWWADDAGPTLAAVRLGDLERARAATQSPRAWAAYDETVASAIALRDEIDVRREAAFADLAAFARQLGWALLGAAVALLLLVALTGLLLNRWVLTPLDLLRRQLRRVARRGEHDRPIEPTGPPELHAAGTDAETLRRQLVAEIDEARAAREGLAQDAPVVAALQHELRAASDPVVRGLRLHGQVQPAEGVLAGDWWDWLPLPGGAAAVVVTDVSGHGAAAGVAAMAVKTAVRPVLESGGDGATALAAAATAFAGEEDRFATVVVVRVDPPTGEVRWANAGHHPPLLLRADGTLERLAPTGPLLSGLGGRWEESGTRLALGDVLLAYTDGLPESRDGAGEELGEPGLADLLTQARDAAAGDPDELVARLVARVRDRAADWGRDDVTVVALSLDADVVRPPARPR